MKPGFDLSLYLIVGPSHVEGDPVPLVEAAVAGGVSIVQLRDKSSTTGGMVATARRLKAALQGTGVPLLINDRADVAVAAEADGLHIGRDDLSPMDARRIIGRNRLLGVTVKTEREAKAVDPTLVDYASIGGVFETISKNNPDPPIGMDGLRDRLAVLSLQAPGLPVCAIAGIDAERAGPIIAAGTNGVCIVSAITQATDPKRAAAEIRAVVDRTIREQERAIA